ncbi:uncharacterized protein LOC113425203 [Notechis scutatus]|uniref:Uncharacterized protein LOC113425203 n=1 Tax=Notechis scutatus TaxID=8663 RepID=A0A6J1VSS2_9SAUR|nr:uncharacterized protein LOC113425203 [Notechis scutatus]
MVLWDKIERILGQQTKLFHEMTSITTTVVKTRKKPTPTTTTVISSPSTQRYIEGMLTLEKTTVTMTTQAMQATLLTNQETMMKLQENMTKYHGEMKTEMEEVKRQVRKDIQKLDEKVGQIHEILQKNEQRLQTIEKRTEKTERKLESVDQRMQERDKEVENPLIQLEMKRASFYLRFQNVVEMKEADLTDITAEATAEALQREKSEIINELDEVYRLYTNYARRFRLPKEVHIRFAWKKVRDIIYKITREEPMTYKGKEIITLKQILKRVQEQRKDYRFLAARLNKKKIV